MLKINEFFSRKITVDNVVINAPKSYMSTPEQAKLEFEHCHRHTSRHLNSCRLTVSAALTQRSIYSAGKQTNQEKAVLRTTTLCR